jgi:anti-anti-sigma factor
MQDANKRSLQPEPEIAPLVVHLDGEFDHLSERLFMACVQQLLVDGHPSVLFDFARVRFPDASAIRCLLQANQRFRRANRQMALVGIPPAIEQILTVVGIHHPITFYDRLEDAGVSGHAV